MAAKDLDGTATEQRITRISASGIEPARRADFISDEISRRLVGARADAFDRGSAQFDYAILDVGVGARLVRAHLAGLDIERGRQHLADGDDNMTLFVPLSGELIIEQGGRRERVERGGGALVTNSRDVFTRFPDTRFAMLQVRRNVLPEVPGEPLHLGASRMVLLRSYMLAVLRQAAHAPVPAIAAWHLQELVRATFTGKDCGTAALANEAVQRARVHAMRNLMVAQHGNARLAMRDVAGRLGISERSGYAAFRAEGVSFADELAAIRLDRAFALLGNGARRILDVALDVGFADLSHFNRRFRQRFGLTPSEARRRD